MNAIRFDCYASYISARRVWRSEQSLPENSTELKPKAARRDISIPPRILPSACAKLRANPTWIMWLQQRRWSFRFSKRRPHVVLLSSLGDNCIRHIGGANNTGRMLENFPYGKFSEEQFILYTKALLCRAFCYITVGATIGRPIAFWRTCNARPYCKGGSICKERLPICFW